MRLSAQHIKRLQTLLERHYDLIMTDEQAQQAGLAILRFRVAKQMRNATLKANSNEDEYETQQTQPSAKANK